MSRPLVVLVAHDSLLGAEIQDLNKDLECMSFDTRTIHPVSASEYAREIERLKPVRVILPRQPLGMRVPELPFAVPTDAQQIAPHLRFVYERWGRRLRPLSEARARAA